MSIGFNMILTIIIGVAFLVIGVKVYSFIRQSAVNQVDNQIQLYLKEVVFAPLTVEANAQIFKVPLMEHYSTGIDKLYAHSKSFDIKIPFYSMSDFYANDISSYKMRFDIMYYVSPILMIFPSKGFHVYLYEVPSGSGNPTSDNGFREALFNEMLPPKSVVLNHKKSVFFDKKTFVDRSLIDVSPSEKNRDVVVFLKADENSGNSVYTALYNDLQKWAPDLHMIVLSPDKNDNHFGNVTYLFYNNSQSGTLNEVNVTYLSYPLLAAAIFSFGPKNYISQTKRLLKRAIYVNDVYYYRFNMVNKSLSHECKNFLNKYFPKNPFVIINQSFHDVISQDLSYDSFKNLYNLIQSVENNNSAFINQGCPSVLS